jgi:DnaA family protein
VIAQLPLNIQLRDDATLASFYAGDNTQARNAVKEFSEGRGEPFIYLWGVETGKTHLLQAACQAASEQNIAAVYIPLTAYRTLSPSLLQGVEDLPLVCLDDIDSMVHLPQWEEALFHLFNRIKAKNGRLLVTANVAPKYLQTELQDLKSRLAWGVTYQLHRLNDEQKLSALQHRARLRGLQLTKTVGQFLLHRSTRSLTELFATLEILDKASLTEQRRLTIPFVKQILQL